MSSKYMYILAPFLFFLGLSLGFFAGKQMILPQKTMSTTPESSVQSNKLFSSQTASLRAEVYKINGRNLSVKKLNNNVSGDVTVASSAVLIKAGKIMPIPSDLSSVELNKEVLISVEMRNGNYEIISLQYSAPLPSLPPVGSNPKFTPQSSTKPQS